MRRPERQAELPKPDEWNHNDFGVALGQMHYLYDIALSMRQIADFLEVWTKR